MTLKKPYMPYLVKAELKTHIYQHNIDEIIRNDATIADDAIEAAIDMAKGYLSRYDLVQLFGTDTEDPIVRSASLKNHVKDLACWYVLKLGNAGVDMELMKECYNDAVKWLKDVQAERSNPDWPYRDMDAAPKPPNGDSIHFTSNRKRKYDN